MATGAFHILPEETTEQKWEGCLWEGRLWEGQLRLEPGEF